MMGAFETINVKLKEQYISPLFYTVFKISNLVGVTKIKEVYITNQAENKEHKLTLLEETQISNTQKPLKALLHVSGLRLSLRGVWKVMVEFDNNKKVEVVRFSVTHDDV